MVKKARLTKQIGEEVFSDGTQWTVHHGKLKRGKGHPGKNQHSFQVLGEKLPYSALAKVKKHVLSLGHKPKGVYVAHDSMGCPRYIGRGNVFQRLESRKKAQTLAQKGTSPFTWSRKRSTSAKSKLCSYGLPAFCLSSTRRKSELESRTGTSATTKQAHYFMSGITKRERRPKAMNPPQQIQRRSPLTVAPWDEPARTFSWRRGLSPNRPGDRLHYQVVSH